MKKSIILNPNMGEQIVKHLRQFAELPTDGILAGQAVDSAITDLFGKGGGVYNDLDVFRSEERPFENRNKLTANALTKRGSPTLITPTSGGYQHMTAMLAAVTSYGIHSVAREDMLNTVNCVLHWPVKDLTAQHIITGFDINCTRVAVDLSTNQLVWDRHYEEFLRSRQLRIAMMHTPWHTFLRLLKKEQELPGVYLNKDVSAEACVAVAESDWLQMMLKNHNVSLSFGKKNVELAHRFESEWSPYFDMTCKTLYLTSQNKWSEHSADLGKSGKTTELWGMKPRASVDADFQRRCNRMGAALVFFGAQLAEANRRRIAPAAYNKLNATLAQQRIAMGEDNSAEFIGPHNLITAGNKEKSQFGAYFIRAHAELWGTDYVQGQALSTMAEKLATWLSQHSQMAKNLVGLTLNEQYRRMQTINDVCRRFGKQYFDGDTQLGIGVLEGMADHTVFTTEADVENALMDYYRRNHSPFDVTPLPLPQAFPAEFAGFTVKELLTPLALRNEGTLMGHCVGGYADAVRRNGSRILAVRYRDERRSLDCSTVELKGNFKDSVDKWSLTVQQNYSAGNKHPTSKNAEFVQYLLGYLSTYSLIETCLRETAQKTSKQLMHVARKYESEVKYLVHEKVRLIKLKDRARKAYDDYKGLDDDHWNKLRDADFKVRDEFKKVQSSIEQLKAKAAFLRKMVKSPGMVPSKDTFNLVQEVYSTQARTAALEAPVTPQYIANDDEDDFAMAF